VEDCLLDRTTVLEVLDHDPLEQFRRDGLVPHTLGVHDDNRPLSADAKARGLAALHTRGTEEQPFAFEEAGQQRIESTSAPVR
jgi:hypothetical protein